MLQPRSYSRFSVSQRGTMAASPEVCVAAKTRHRPRCGRVKHQRQTHLQ